MRIVLFYHSLVSDWNHGNAHFLRGIASELISRGHDVRIFEPANGWSRTNLLQDAGELAIQRFQRIYPRLSSTTYDPSRLDLDAMLDGADLVLVHEWNDEALVEAIGARRSRGGRFRVLFHDTHHRTITDPSIWSHDLSDYDGILAFGESLQEQYRARGWGRRAWVWHEAADTRVFRPIAYASPSRDLVFIGNWGDDERTTALRELLIGPASRLRLSTRVYGVRYPTEALEELKSSGIEYCGWCANFDVPRVFSTHRVTIHVPRAPYVHALPGIPTIRVFEALACGIPLVSAAWDDVEGLFRPGRDYLVVRSGAEMESALHMISQDAALALELRKNGLETIRARHTCAHRVEELLAIHREIVPPASRSTFDKTEGVA